MPNLRSSGPSPIPKTPVFTPSSNISKTISTPVETPILKTAKTAPKSTEKPVVGTEQETSTLHQAIDQAPSSEIKERANNVPSIEALQQAKGNLKTPEHIRDTSQGVANFAKKEVMNDVTASKSSAVETKAVERIHEALSDRALANKLKSLESETLIRARSTFAVSLQNGRRNLDSQINQGLSHVIAPYEKKTKSLIGSATSKSAEAELGQQIKSWVQEQGKNSDVVLSIQNMSSTEIDQMAADFLKGAKGYSSKDMQKLSDRKQAFIRVVSENLQEGAKTAGDNTKGSQSIRNNMNEIKREYAAAIKNEGGMKSQLGRELMLRSDASVLSAVHDDVSQTNKLLKKAVLSGINEGLGGSVSSTQVVPQGKANLQVPEQLSINGKTYGAPKYLAEGGFANIIRYTNTDNPNDQVVLKQLKTDETVSRSEMRSEASEELLNQIELEGSGGHKNLNSLTGAIRGGDDELYIIQDMAKGGSLDGVNRNLAALSEQGRLPSEIQELLGTHLIKGMLQGMDHIQNERQGHHFDLKLPNVLLGSDGNAKITDFGFSGLGNSRSLARLKGNDNPKYKSPEFIGTGKMATDKESIDLELQNQGVKTFENRTFNGQGSNLSNDEKVYFQALEEKEGTEAMRVAREIRDNESLLYSERYNELFESRQTTEISSRADTWNAGVAALELLDPSFMDSSDIYNQRFMAKVSKSVAEFGQDSNNRMKTASTVGETGEVGMGITAKDKLINGLMHPDPEKRTNFKEALKNSLFIDERLDKPEVGQLLLKISQVDPKNLSVQDSSEIQQLVNALKA